MNAPLTIDGEIAWSLLTEGGGQWRRAGMAGQISGLDVTACLARPSADEADAEALEWILVCGEAGAIAGADKLNQSDQEG